MFTELESKILEIAQKHFNEKISKDELEIIEKHGWGHENWFQNELLIALNRAGLDTKTLSKKGKDADLVIETEGKNIGIELRTTVKGRTPRLIKALSQHKNAEIYLFLTQISQTAKTIENLNNKLSQNYHYKIAELKHPDWMLVLVKKKKE